MYFLLSLLSCASLCIAIFVSTPQECGGDHIMAHAMALFSTHPERWKLEYVRVYAPPAEPNGVYLGGNKQNDGHVHERETLNTDGKSQRGLLAMGRYALKWIYDRVTGRSTATAVKGNSYSHASFSSLSHACEPMFVWQDPAAMKGRVAIVRRGYCPFSTKVLIMQQAGAVGVVIVNTNATKTITNTSSMCTVVSIINSTRIGVPAVMISYHDWMKFARCTEQTTVKFSGTGEEEYEQLNWDES